MRSDRKKLLEEVMAWDFTLIELNLFLDTHPDDRQAMADYNAALKQSAVVRAKYEKDFGPLTAMSPYATNSTFEWIEEPWPWEINFAQS
ncbi:MAG: spore coat protein CotJB [Methylocystaceae bacterium]